MDRRPQGDRIVMWHWNANGYRCRKAVLQQHLRSLDQKELPDVIAIQETHAEDPKITSLPGYRAYARPPSARTCGKGAAQGVCTFVRKGITSVGKDEILNYKDSAIEANVTEIIIAGKKGRGKNKASTTVYIANVYSNPQHGNQRFKTLLHKIRDAAHGSGAAAVVCGDFNAPHEELGYTRTTVKGKRLLEDAEEASFELLTDPAQPTRIGTSTARDTTPDLSFVHLPRGGTARWKNTGWNLGSDHYIVEVTIPLAHARVVDGTTKRRQLLTDWHKFREADLGEVDDVERWSASLVSAAKDATTEVEILHAAANQLGEAEMHKRLNDKRLLERVGLSSPEEQDHETSPLTESTMRRLVVYPLPKNMGPGESEGRRAARARALLLQHQNDEGAVYVDVAKVKNKDAYVAAAVAATTGKIVTSCSVRTRSASQAEEMAIALAARSPGVRTILSDSKTAIRSFSRGAVCGAAARALASDAARFLVDCSFRCQEKGTVYIVQERKWVPCEVC
ncbi:hypothetical protein MRX96_035427 [Rhipicephalus microplus]